MINTQKLFQAVKDGDFLEFLHLVNEGTDIYAHDEQFNAKQQVLDLLTGKELDVNKLILNAVLLRSQELVQFAIAKTAEVDTKDIDG